MDSAPPNEDAQMPQVGSANNDALTLPPMVPEFRNIDDRQEENNVANRDRPKPDILDQNREREFQDMASANVLNPVVNPVGNPAWFRDDPVFISDK